MGDTSDAAFVPFAVGAKVSAFAHDVSMRVAKFTANENGDGEDPMTKIIDGTIKRRFRVNQDATDPQYKVHFAWLGDSYSVHHKQLMATLDMNIVAGMLIFVIR